MGPLATACFMEMVVNMTDAQRDCEHIPMIIYNRPSVPDRTCYIVGKSGDSPLPEIISTGKKLASLGADYIAVPCVTAYFFYDEIKRAIDVPVIDMIAETVACLKERKIRRVGLMATDGTISGGFFRRGIEIHGISVAEPSADGQARLMDIIYGGIKANQSFNMEDFDNVEDELRDKGADVIILGCTELSLIHRNYPIGKGFLDAMEVLARKSILLCGGRLKSEFNDLIT